MPENDDFEFGAPLSFPLDERHTWNLYVHLAATIRESIEFFRPRTHGYPMQLASPEEWDAVLQKIVTGFELDENGDPVDPDALDEAFDLLKAYFLALWD